VLLMMFGSGVQFHGIPRYGMPHPAETGGTVAGSAQGAARACKAGPR
jgi:hypothetical protein